MCGWVKMKSALLSFLLASTSQAKFFRRNLKSSGHKRVNFLGAGNTHSPGQFHAIINVMASSVYQTSATASSTAAIGSASSPVLLSGAGMTGISVAYLDCTDDDGKTNVADCGSGSTELPSTAFTSSPSVWCGAVADGQRVCNVVATPSEKENHIRTSVTSIYLPPPAVRRIQ